MTTGPIIDDGHGLLLEGRYRLDVGNALPHLGVAGAKAVGVTDRADPDANLYAVLCAPETFVRQQLLRDLMDRPAKLMRCPQAAATVQLKDGKHAFAIIFNHANAQLLTRSVIPGKVREPDLMSGLVPRLTAALAEIQARSIHHRSIRPETLLVTAGGDVILDQCVVGLPAAGQPDAYEPLPSQMASLGCRGEGVSTDDVFAIGVTMLHFITGEPPAGGAKGQQLLSERILRGSYDVLLQRRKFSTAFQIMLAGVLRDDEQKRWTFEDLQRWSSGLWDMPRPAGGGRRATRPYIFRNAEVFSPQLLAWSFQRYPDEALPDIRSGRVEKWLRNVLGDEMGADAIVRGTDMAQGEGSVSARDRSELVARAILALDPQGPLRFRSIIATSSGMAGGLWRAIAEGDTAWQEDFVMLFETSLVDEWMLLGGRAARTGIPAGVLNRVRAVMREGARKGFGVERALYELLGHQPCMSPALRDQIASTPGSVMAAMDRRAGASGDSELTIDRHVAGFLAAYDRRLERSLRSLHAGDGSADALLRTARFLAELQQIHYPHPVPGLTRAFATTLAPVANEMRSRVRRMVIEKKVESLARRGDLLALLTELDLDSALEHDSHEFHRAREEYHRLEHLVTHLSDYGPAQRELAMRRGYRYARLFSSSVCFMTVFYFVMEAML